eukprot:tig00001471_g8870.t1
MEIEHALVKVPHEAALKAIKAGEKALDKELNHVLTVVNDLGHKPVTPEEARASLDGLVHRLHGLKRKLEDNRKQGDGCMQKCRTRVEHLRQLEAAAKTGGDAAARLNVTRLDRILVDHMLREGFYTSAQLLAKEGGIAELVDVEIFLASKKVIESLKRHECDAALAWCSENKAKLKRIKSNLEFRLRLQEYVELLRAGRLMDAIAYSRKHLAPSAGTYMKEIQQAMAALAFLRDPHNSQYAFLFEEGRWGELVGEFKRDMYQLHSLPTDSLLSITLQAGLSSLKTPMCYQEENKNGNCPVCQDPMNRLAEKLPFSHHIHSSLVCRITGEVMDEHNPPVVLPNGHVYSRVAVEEMAAASDGVVTCPRTGAPFRIEQVRKVFIS